MEGVPQVPADKPGGLRETSKGDQSCVATPHLRQSRLGKAEERSAMDEQGQSLKIMSFCDCVEQDVQHVLRGDRWVCENCGHAIPE
jgi:hypothetical protein